MVVSTNGELQPLPAANPPNSYTQHLPKSPPSQITFSGHGAAGAMAPRSSRPGAGGAQEFRVGASGSEQVSKLSRDGGAGYFWYTSAF